MGRLVSIREILINKDCPFMIFSCIINSILSLLICGDPWLYNLKLREVSFPALIRRPIGSGTNMETSRINQVLLNQTSRKIENVNGENDLYNQKIEQRVAEISEHFCSNNNNIWPGQQPQLIHSALGSSGYCLIETFFIRSQNKILHLDTNSVF